MGLPRSTYYDVPGIPVDDTEIEWHLGGDAACDRVTYAIGRPRG